MIKNTTNKIFSKKKLNFFARVKYYFYSSLSFLSYFSYKRYGVLSNYLYKKYKDILIDEPDTNKIGSNYKTFVFWWHGLDEKTPFVVRTCISSIRKYSKEVILITKDNYFKYVDIPNYIIDKVNKGIISLTHFSDILRVSLLYKYGGLWLDATVYLNKPFDDISNYSFYSPRLKLSILQKYFPSRGKWAIFALASSKGSVIMKNAQNVLFEYHKYSDGLIDYFFIDYTLEIQYRFLHYPKEIINKCPFNNANINMLNLFLPTLVFLHRFNKRHFDNLSKNTCVFKMTYKYKRKKIKANSYLNVLSKNVI